MVIKGIDELGEMPVYYDIQIRNRYIIETAGVATALSKFSESNELLTFLNSINNQGIESINFNKMSYCLDGEEISIFEMGTAEQLFLVTYYAVCTKKTIAIMHAYRHLRDDVLQIYLNWLKDNDKDNYVNLIIVNRDDRYVLRKVSGLQC